MLRDHDGFELFGALVTKMGDPPGDAAIYPAGYPPAIITADCIKLTPNPEICSVQFLKYLLRTAGAKKAIEEETQGVAQQKLSLKRFRSIRLPIPPLEDQRRIVAKIEALFARSRRAKEALDAIPPLLDRLRQSILAAAFRGDLTADWRAQHPDVEPADKLLERIRTERRRVIRSGGRVAAAQQSWRLFSAPGSCCPKTWTVAPLDAVADVQLGQRRAPEYAGMKEYAYIRAANIKWGFLDLSDVKRMGFADPESLALRSGDVVLTEASGSPSEVGKPAIWRGEIADCCFQATVLRLRSLSHDDVLPGWIYFFCLAAAVSGRFAELAPGIGMVHLTANRMRNFELPLAPVEEQRTATTRLTESLAKIQSVADRVRALKNRLTDLESSILAQSFASAPSPVLRNSCPV